MYSFGYGASDAFSRVVWSIDEGTIWAPGFSEKKFNKIRIGMNSKEVLNILGRPLETSGDCQEEGCFWHYTKQDSGTSDFDQRWIVFNKSFQVEEIRKSFFID